MMTNPIHHTNPLPRVALVATGGTIAGTLTPGAETWAYTSAQRSGESLVMGIPGLLHKAQWRFEQPYSIGSQNLELSHMLHLRASICSLLQSPEVDGIVVTHGTDTMEDMLYFLYLTLPADLLRKPLLFTGAMLPSDHIDADGPGNISQTFQFLIDNLPPVFAQRSPYSPPFGLVMQGLYTPADRVQKNSTSGLDAFDGEFSVRASAEWRLSLQQITSDPSANKLGEFAPWFNTNTTSHPLFEAMEVPVVYCVPGNGPVRQLNDLLNRKPAAVIVAAPGHGNIPDACVPPLRRLLVNGVSVVRASRVQHGGVEEGGEFDALAEFRQPNGALGVFSEAGDLNLNKCVMRERLKALANSLSI